MHGPRNIENDSVSGATVYCGHILVLLKFRYPDSFELGKENDRNKQHEPLVKNNSSSTYNIDSLINKTAFNIP